jgi:hypothetical protein
MPSIKQIQGRLLTKKNVLHKVNSGMIKAEKSKNEIAQKKLTHEKGSLEKDIMKLERLLIIMEKASRKKISVVNKDGDTFI